MSKLSVVSGDAVERRSKSGMSERYNFELLSLHLSKWACARDSRWRTGSGVVNVKGCELLNVLNKPLTYVLTGFI